MLGVFLVAALGVVSSARAAFADPHLPIIEIDPIATWAGAADAHVVPGAGIGVVSGPITLNGTATLPLFKGLSFSYDRENGDAFYNTLANQPLPGGGTIVAGSYYDVVQNYRLNYQLGKSINLQLAETTRQRVCCPAASVSDVQWHIGSFGVTYTTPYLKPIHGLFVLNARGISNYHNPGPAQGAAYGGLDVSCTSVSAGVAGPVCNDYKARTLYESSESATYVLPLDARGGFVMTGTFLTGAGDFFQAFPFPDRYNITVFTATKKFSPQIGLKLGAANIWQVQQGNPFPPPGAIHLVSYTATLQIHLDLNQIFAAPAKH
ncbi:MAG: hypothetical protein IAI49_04445 [Candidatus Eremiobacteraeota bacterium]|nr:hypothetical protein [Candidatus Eremiobacteraeota bacterium]